MGIAITLAQYLAERGVKYDVVGHPHTATASESARTSHISLNRLCEGGGAQGRRRLRGCGLAGRQPHPVQSAP